MKFCWKLLIFNLLATFSWGQKITTSEEVVAAALQNNPTIRAAAFETQAKKYAEKSTRNLPNPEVNFESPTGEFYTVGVSQSFEFPTIYKKQRNLAKAQTSLAQIGQKVSENDLRYNVRLLYLETQMADYQLKRDTERDSLYQKIRSTAERQFKAGEIDFLQKTLVENEASNLKQSLNAATINLKMLREQLALLAGFADFGTLETLAVDTSYTEVFFSEEDFKNPSVAFENQVYEVSLQQIGVAKSRGLPNFSLGYMNQGARNSQFDYRFRASVGVPLWVGQYRAGVKVAESENQAAAERASAKRQNVAIQILRSQSAVATSVGKVRFYQSEALPRSQTIIATALRLKEAGQSDYPTFLRTLEAAFATQSEYGIALASVGKARIEIMYLLGM
jgi:outer membrane protein, heavy metal efflux system